jgi:hypothetical protein
MNIVPLCLYTMYVSLYCACASVYCARGSAHLYATHIVCICVCACVRVYVCTVSVFILSVRSSQVTQFGSLD